MALQYKLEYSYDESKSSDSSVYIQIRRDPPVYQARIDKEDYDALPSNLKDDFLTSLFNVAGVTELSSRAYRIWIMKSPVFSWQEVLTPVLNYLADFYGETGIESLPGSGNIDGTGFTISNPNQRRKI